MSRRHNAMIVFLAVFERNDMFGLAMDWREVDRVAAANGYDHGACVAALEAAERAACPKP